MTNSMDQKVVLVTGGARGMGAAQARRLAADGAHVCVTDILMEEAEKLVKAIASDGGSASHHELDVSNSEAWAVLLSEIERAFGRLDGLVNNAGIPMRASLMDLSDDDWRRVMSVNLDGVFYGVRAAAPLMRESGGGSIVNISSIAGQIGYHATGYAASKWGVTGLTKSAAIALAPWKIRVNSVHPGLVGTVLMEQAEPAFIEATVRATPLGRAGESDEVASSVAFLLSDDAKYLTGSEITVDGGLASCGAYWQILERRAELG